MATAYAVREGPAELVRVAGLGSLGDPDVDHAEGRVEGHAHRTRRVAALAGLSSVG